MREQWILNLLGTYAIINFTSKFSLLNLDHHCQSQLTTNISPNHTSITEQLPPVIRFLVKFTALANILLE